MYDAWERRQADTDPAVVARRRTTFSFLRRLTIVLVSTIGIWNVLSIFPMTEEIARAMLASSAVIALIAGLALSTPSGTSARGCSSPSRSRSESAIESRSASTRGSSSRSA